MSDNRTYKELEKDSNEHYQFLKKFCLDYCKDKKDQREFFENLSFYVDAEIEMEKFCNG